MPVGALGSIKCGARYLRDPDSTLAASGVTSGATLEFMGGGLRGGGLFGKSGKLGSMFGNMMAKNDGSDLEIFGQSKPPHLGATANQQSPHSFRRYRPAPCCAWKLGCCSALRGCAERRWADGG